jgi:hypothetical protein
MLLQLYRIMAESAEPGRTASQVARASGLAGCSRCDVVASRLTVVTIINELAQRRFRAAIRPR